MQRIVRSRGRSRVELLQRERVEFRVEKLARPLASSLRTCAYACNCSRKKKRKKRGKRRERQPTTERERERSQKKKEEESAPFAVMWPVTLRHAKRLPISIYLFLRGQSSFLSFVLPLTSIDRWRRRSAREIPNGRGSMNQSHSVRGSFFGWLVVDDCSPFSPCAGRFVEVVVVARVFLWTDQGDRRLSRVCSDTPIEMGIALSFSSSRPHATGSPSSLRRGEAAIAICWLLH